MVVIPGIMEEIMKKFDLDDGTYILIFHDTYGDGGVQGNVKFIKSGIELRNFVFNSGSQRTVEFNVRNSQDIVIANQKKKKFR